MRNLKGFSDTEEWVDNIIDICKNIMLEINDEGIVSRVFKNFHSEKKALEINCIAFYKPHYVFNKKIHNEVYDRLSDYMQLEGFKEIKKDTEPSQFTYIPQTETYIARMIFIKEDLDSYYIGHLRYLNKYNKI